VLPLLVSPWLIPHFEWSVGLCLWGRQKRKEKKYIYPTYFPLSPTHLRLRCSSFFNPIATPTTYICKYEYEKHFPWHWALLLRILDSSLTSYFIFACIPTASFQRTYPCFPFCSVNINDKECKSNGNKAGGVPMTSEWGQVWPSHTKFSPHNLDCVPNPTACHSCMLFLPRCGSGETMTKQMPISISLASISRRHHQNGDMWSSLVGKPEG
jgi:hypothetical protein